MLYAEGDPHGLCSALRADQPIFRHEWNGGESFVVLMRHRDIADVLRDTDTFSSASGTLLTGAPLRMNAGGNKMLALTDPPRHTELRRHLAPYFAPKQVARLETDVRGMARTRLAELADAGPFDVMTELTVQIPLATSCALLGVPAADWPMLHELTSVAFGAYEPIEQAAAHNEILLYFGELARERRGAPGDDITSVLVSAAVEGAMLSDEDVMLNCNNILLGGSEAVRHAIAGAFVAFVEYPDQWDLFGSLDLPVERVVDEILRWTSPAIHLLRTATRDSQIGDERIECGEVIGLWLLSANRDGDVFENADRFDVSRAINPHLTLGAGRHFCIGSALAKLQLRVILEEVRSVASEIRLERPPRRLASIAFYGFESVMASITGRIVAS
jgi:cytochrome P450